MEIRWARLAAFDLDRIFEHIRKENPVAACEFVKAIYDGCGSLKIFRSAAGRAAWQVVANWYFRPCPISQSTASVKMQSNHPEFTMRLRIGPSPVGR
jgi:hypothetical protein